MGSTDDTFVTNLISIFIESTMPELSELNLAFQNKDLKKIASIAHSMKSNIEIFSVDSIKETIRILEDKEKLPFLPDDKLAGYVEQINTVIQNVVAEMRRDYSICN